MHELWLGRPSALHAGPRPRPRDVPAAELARDLRGRHGRDPRPPRRRQAERPLLRRCAGRRRSRTDRQAWSVGGRTACAPTLFGDGVCFLFSVFVFVLCFASVVRKKFPWESYYRTRLANCNYGMTSKNGPVAEIRKCMISDGPTFISNSNIFIVEQSLDGHTPLFFVAQRSENAFM